MELEAASRQARLVRMDDHDRESDGKVQTFGKRCQSAKRDPNCSVVIRGWLNKKDSSGLKLWKRRWFVLSNYCLFYYKDSREESVLGSIPLPSYKILFCTPRECKNRKFTFKVVHQGMRSYFFSADTQEDMLGWVRALSQSAAMEPDSSMNRRCSSYHDFTQIGGSSESVDLPKSPSDDEGLSQKHRHVSRTLSEPSKLSGGRMGRSHSEQRERRSIHQRNSRTPSPDLSRRRACGPNKEEDFLLGQIAPSQTDVMATGSLTSRGQLGSRPHTPMGRVDIRPHDDPIMLPHTLYYAPASPNLEFKSNPSTPGSERWQSLSKPAPVYGSVHHSSGRRPLGKSYSTGAHADLLPPLPPSSRASHSPHPPQHHHHHHHHRSHLSVCVLPPAMAPKPDPREMPPLRPLESDADAVLTRLCGCDKLLQSLSVELAQLQMDKDNVQCALEVSRLQLEEWKSHGPQAHEEALTEKALLQEELVTVRARMCDVSLEIERVWCQYERMESELSVVRSQLQHICNFGMPQEQSQAQRELWMMEDILDGLKSNRSHFCYLLGIQRHHLFQSTAPHPGSPGSPTECLPVDVEEEPPVRPPLPQELQESQSRNMSHGWAESPYEAIYSHTVDPVHRRGNSQPALLNVKAHRDPSDSQSGSKWIPPDTTNQSTKKLKMKMSEEEQIERMKRNQERVTNRKKPPVPAPGAQTQGQSSEPKAEAPFPLRVTRVVTAVLPSSLVARRVSVEDPPAELDTPLAEQIPSEKQLNLAEQGKKLLSKPPRRPLLENPDQNWSSAEMDQDQPIKKTYKDQHQGASRTSTKELLSEVSRTESLETSSNQIQDDAGLENGSASSNIRKVEQSTALLTSNMDYDLCLTHEQREAKLRRVERIRERVIRSAVRESATTHSQLSVMGKEKEVHHVPSDAARKQRLKAGHDGHGSCGDNLRSSGELQLSSAISEDKEEEHQQLNNQAKLENRTQHSGRPGVAKSKIKRPASPYHISSMTVYPKDGGKRFIGLKDDEQKKVEDNPDGDDNESDSKASDLRAKWFLSTNQWKGFIPLQIPATETLCNEEAADNQAASSDGITDSNEMLSAVSESLEKMKENHSLFYKIACDISISDSDITKNDGNSCAQTSSGPEDKDPLLITESVPADAASNVGPSSDQENKDVTQPVSLNGNESSGTAASKPRDSTVDLQEKATKDASVFEKSAADECEHNSRSESQLKVKETTGRVCIGDTDPKQTLDGSASQTREERSRAKESGDRKFGRVRSEELKKSASLCDEKNENVPEQGNKSSAALSSSVREAGRVIRSASFGKARVTVLRTSL
ncbi:pleckstrin homology domain-containing family A member 4 isoform X3 [Astatotilapia calliptera]|uniref:pleckstrin homology domain-containing family A member 4 isoform X3 n=2 Tax=Astatotilapia calliptera TaxID=8154 RepID=UPI000E426B34|nr:pleckstrin homology domain-containing family A member 4 isoform X3 [Astatotilapia calliptera]